MVAQLGSVRPSKTIRNVQGQQKHTLLPMYARLWARGNSNCASRELAKGTASKNQKPKLIYKR